MRHPCHHPNELRAVTETCRRSVTVFEMSDQDNFFVGLRFLQGLRAPAARPAPYSLPASRPFRQARRRDGQGRPAAAVPHFHAGNRCPSNSTACRTLRGSVSSSTAGRTTARVLARADRLAAVGPGRCRCTSIRRQGHGAPALAWLRWFGPAVRRGDRAGSRRSTGTRRAGGGTGGDRRRRREGRPARLDAILQPLAALLEAVLGAWAVQPPCPPLRRSTAGGVGVLPGRGSARGMFSYFTELNRKRLQVVCSTS